MDFVKVRFLIFLIILVTLSIFEFFYSYRKRVLTRLDRWPVNFSLTLIDSIIVRLLFPMGLVGIAKWAALHHVGVFHYFDLGWGRGIFAILTFIILDFAIYLQHLCSHKWMLLWRFHKVHHSDSDLDVSSALRFHPVEIVYSYLYKILIILFFGADSTGILIFEIVLNSMAMFNHANIHIPLRIEKKLRFLLVTPQMHIIHHSIEKFESDNNFGFNFSLWDFVFKTYQDSFISKGIIGQNEYNKLIEQKLFELLFRPFRKLNNDIHR